MLKKYALYFLMLSALPLPAQQLIEGIVAVVGNEIILRSEVEQYTQQYIFQNRINVQKNPELVNELKQQTLDFLIEQKLLLEKAEQDTITIEDQQLDQLVEQRIQAYVERLGSQDELEKMFDQSMKNIRKDIRKMVKEEEMVKQVRALKFSDIKVSRREVEQFYNEFQDSLPKLEQAVDISHILKLVQPSEEAQREAYEKMLEIKAQLDNGADFSELAEQYSEDPASAKRGGDLGLISRGDFVPEFEAAAFNLNDGEISDIVQTQFGFHIIKMEERRGEKIRTKHILVQVMPNEEDEKRVINELTEIRTQLQAGADFSELALKHSDDENVTKDKGHLGTFEVSKMVVPEFKKAVQDLEPGEISQPFKTEFGYHIVQLKDKKESRTISLEDDWQQVEQFALNVKMEREYRKWLDELRNEVPIDVRENI